MPLVCQLACGIRQYLNNNNMDTTGINQYELIDANEQDALLRLLVNASVFRDFTEELRSGCYLIFLKKNGVTGPEHADFAIKIPSVIPGGSTVNLDNDENLAFYWKNGEFGTLIPCPVVSRRFEVKNHLNDTLSRSLSNQLRIALSLSDSIFSDQYYIGSLTWTLIKHLVRLNRSFFNYQIDRAFKITPVQLNEIKTYIRDHLDQRISVMELAEIIKLSEGYFFEAFKYTTGMTPHRYISTAKMEKAKEMLLNENASVINVGMAVGFDNPAYFSKMFKREVGVSPSQFRLRYRKDAQ